MNEMMFIESVVGEVRHEAELQRREPFTLPVLELKERDGRGYEPEVFKERLEVMIMARLIELGCNSGETWE